MSEYTKGETAGGWIHVSHGKIPIALVHPKYVDKFIATPDMYEALSEILRSDFSRGRQLGWKALAKAESK